MSKNLKIAGIIGRFTILIIAATFLHSCNRLEKEPEYKPEAVELNNKAIQLMQRSQYDSALILFNDWERAEKILDFYLKNAKAGQPIYNAYYAQGQVYEYTEHSGPYAWIGLAALHHVTESGEKKYLPIAQHAAKFLLRMMDKEGGLRGGPALFRDLLEEFLPVSHLVAVAVLAGLVGDALDELLVDPGLVDGQVVLGVLALVAAAVGNHAPVAGLFALLQEKGLFGRSEGLVRVSSEVLEKLDFPGGVDLGRFDPKMNDTFLVAVTECHTREALDTYLDALRKL